MRKFALIAAIVLGQCGLPSVSLANQDVPKGATVAVKVPLKFWHLENPSFATHLPIYSIDASAILATKDWQKGGELYSGEFVVTKVFEFKPFYKLKYTDIELRNDKTWLKVRFQPDSDISRGFQDLTLTGTWKDFESSDYYKSMGFGTVASESSAGPLPQIPDSTKPVLPDSTAATQTVPLTNQDVINMIHAQLPDSTIVKTIQANDRTFDLSVTALIALKNAGVSQSVILEMLSASANRNEAKATGVVTPQPQPSVAASPTESPEYDKSPRAAETALQTERQVNNAVVAGGRDVAQEHNPDDFLTDDQILAAIYRGKAKRHNIGLMLQDQQTIFASGLASALTEEHLEQTGYTMFAYNPEQWIELQAAIAKGEMRPFTLQDVTNEMRLPLLHIRAMPSQAEYITGPALSYSSSVKRIVLSDTARQSTIQPYGLSNDTVESNSAYRSITYSAGNATFSMADVEKLRASDHKSEFFIVVVGTNKNKFFKVKEMYLPKLFPNGTKHGHN